MPGAHACQGTYKQCYQPRIASRLQLSCCFTDAINCLLLQSKPYRYAYSVSAVKPTTFGNALAKFDLQERKYKQWYEPGCVPVEPLMVPAPNATAEDDGVVLSIVMGNNGRSFLLVLDAKNFTELARAKLDWGIPYGFHASFCPAMDSS